MEDLRTPLQTILNLEQQLRGTIAGFMMPSFVVDLPGGGGKRLAMSYQTYDRNTGISTFVAPGLGGAKAARTYAYYDPVYDLKSEKLGAGVGGCRDPTVESETRSCADDEEHTTFEEREVAVM